MEINGIAHIMLTVSDYESCLPFYERHRRERFVQTRVGLHHVSFRTREGIAEGSGVLRGERVAQVPRVQAASVSLAARVRPQSNSSA